MTVSNYSHGKHRKGMLLAHIVFVTKYRRACLVNEYADACKQTLISSAKMLGIEVKEIEADKDHVHMLIDYPPTIAVSTIIKYLKQKSTNSLWQNHNEYLQKYYWQRRILWSSGYFYCSIGEASAETIRQYIRSQG